MLNNASELKDASSEKSGNHLKEQTSFRDNDIINFNVKDNMLWKNWLAYFEGLCTEIKKHNIRKIRNIKKFLKWKALTTYVNNT